MAPVQLTKTRYDEHTSNNALLRSVFVEDLDLLVVASEDTNICKWKIIQVMRDT